MWCEGGVDRNEGPVVGAHVLGEEGPLFKEAIGVFMPCVT